MTYRELMKEVALEAGFSEERYLAVEEATNRKFSGTSSGIELMKECAPENVAAVKEMMRAVLRSPALREHIRQTMEPKLQKEIAKN